MTLVLRTLSKYFPSLRFVVVLVFTCSLFLSILPCNVEAANPCSNSWNVTLKGLKSNYNLEENITGTLSYSIRNESRCPACVQQILIGIIDENGKVSDVACIYDGNPKTCPEETTGTASLSLKCPSTSGKYKILASNYLQYTCGQAMLLYPSKPSTDKIIATITIISGLPQTTT